MTWQEKVRKTEPYTAGEQPKDKTIIKLNSNECPYPPSPAVKEAAERAAFLYESARLYPDMNASLLVNALAEKYGVSPKQVFVGVGSDDVIAMCFLAFFTNGGELLFPDITYSFYEVWADLFQVPCRKIPLTEDFRIDPSDYETGKEQGGIIFPNPNAPTGDALSLSEVERIVAANRDCVVIVDEAYVDFGTESALPLLSKYDNLLVVQTFSKSRAMAGARVGFAIGGEEIIARLQDIKFSFNSYTLNYPAILMGEAAVRDDAYFRKITGRIVNTRERFKKELTRLGFSFPDSKANFVFAKHPDVPARELFDRLREKKLLVRYFNKPRIDDRLRITIGTDEQMDRLVQALEEILQPKS